MNTKNNLEEVKLSQVQVNSSNPRVIRDERFEELVNSILVFPKMLRLRPIIVDETYKALGGNMRYRALSFIAGLSIEDIIKRLSGLEGYNKKTDAEKRLLNGSWDKWKEAPTAFIVKATELSEEEQKEFIIKDNLGYGEWDMELLANEWDDELLKEWGLEKWEKDDEGESSGGDEKKQISTRLFVECEDVEKLASLFSELQDRGFKCEFK
ncbi:MAG: ParB N-terminal domain-containing protein [Bacteroidales bacterium]